jgi:hypothetical protein
MADDKLFIATSQPVVKSATLTFNTENKTSLKYDNDTNEKSVVHGVLVEGAPFIKVSFKITVNGDEVTIIDQVNLGTFPEAGAGMRFIDLRGQYSNGIVVDQDQSFYLASLNNFVNCNTLKMEARFLRDKLKYSGGCE